MSHVVFLTGASSGIGEAVASEYIKQGHKVALTARRKDRLDALVKELGENALALTCDVTKPEDLAAAVKATEEKFGTITVSIANAGFGVAGVFEELTIDDYRRQFETNIFGVLNTAKATLESLKKTKGRLAIVGSVNGTIALPNGSPYGMSKFAVNALSTSLYYELAKYEVSVTHIAPGFVTSQIRMTNNQGVFQEHAKDPVPQWIVVPAAVAAKEIVRGIEKRRREQVVTGHAKVLVFLHRHFPWITKLIINNTGLKARGEAKN